jgi:hypothetical protein
VAVRLALGTSGAWGRGASLGTISCRLADADVNDVEPSMITVASKHKAITESAKSIFLIGCFLLLVGLHRWLT